MFWSDELKVGEKVIYEDSYGKKSVQKVERLTATMLILENGERFNRETGLEVGRSGYRIRSIHKYNVEEVAKLTERNYRTKMMYTIRNTDLTPLSTQQLARIMTIIKEVY